MNRSRIRKLVKLKKTIASSRSLGFISIKFLDKELWMFSYLTVAKGVALGLFWMMIPLPFQMIPAVIMGVYIRANMPATLLCVWLSNPFTWVPLYFTNYLFGSYLLGLNINIVNWQEYTQYMMDNIGKFWQPLYLGSITGGIIVASTGFVLVYLFKILFKR